LSGLRHAGRNRILAAGHPITHDIEIDVEQLKEQLRKGEFVIRGQRLEVVE